MSEHEVARLTPSDRLGGYTVTVILEHNGTTITLDSASITEAQLTTRCQSEWGTLVRYADITITARLPRLPATLAQEPVDAPNGDPSIDH